MKKILPYFLVLICLVSIATAATTVTRSFSQSTVGKNTQVTVTLTVDVSGDTYYLIDEEFPAGLTVVSATGEGDYTTKQNHIFWTKLSGASSATYTYVLNTGSVDGNYMFAGTYGSESKQETAVAGTNKLTVGSGGTTIGGDTGGGSSSNTTMYVIIGAVGLVIAFFFMKKK